MFDTLGLSSMRPANQKGLMPLRKKLDNFGGFLHLNLGFSGHSCFYQTDRIGLVAGGGKLLLTVKVVPTKELQATTHKC